MARARRMRRGRINLKRKTDWIASATGRASETFSENFVDLVAIIDLQDLENHQDTLTVERMVGEYALFCAEPTPDYSAHVYMGIAIRQCDDTGAVIPINPESNVDADSEDWMWRRHYILHNNGTFDATPGLFRGCPVASTWEEAHFDIHVRRKMEGRDQLVLFTFYEVLTGAGTNLLQSFNFRTLVKLS